MNKPFFVSLLLVCGTFVPLCAGYLPAPLAEYAQDDVQRYINRFKEIAMQEMERTGVPASIKLAQGLLESGAGKSDLARNAKNHFGIKCGSQWRGDEYYKKDDDYDDNGRLIKSCFRQYRNADASFVAHSEFLRDPAKSFRYGFLFRLEPTDYRSWAEGLRRAGYATNPRYPELLISLIERNNLYQYDQPGAVVPEEIETPVAEAIAGILQTNDVIYFVNDAPLTVKEVARQVDVSVRRLLDYNEGLREESQQVAAGERVFLQPKRNSFRGKDRFHTAQAGESLLDIAQQYGLKLRKLARRNRLEETVTLAAGTPIKLRGSRVKEAPQGDEEGSSPTPPVNLPTDENGNLELEPTDDDATTEPETTVASPGPGVIRPGGNPTPPPVTTDPVPPGPGADPIPTSPTAPTTTVPVSNRAYHSVVAGETLYGISRQYGLTVPALKALNQLTTNSIFVGQQLRVK